MFNFGLIISKTSRTLGRTTRNENEVDYGKKRGRERTCVNLRPESLLFQRCTQVSGRTTRYCHPSIQMKLVINRHPLLIFTKDRCVTQTLSKGENVMEVLYPRCCGLDVHRNMVVACLSIIEAGQRRRRDSHLS